MRAQFAGLESTSRVIEGGVCFREFSDHVITQVGQAVAQVRQPVIAKIRDNSIQPGAKLGLPAKVWKSRPGADKGLLREIECFVLILKDAQGKVVDVTLMFIHQGGKGICFTFLSALEYGLFIFHARLPSKS